MGYGTGATLVLLAASAWIRSTRWTRQLLSGVVDAEENLGSQPEDDRMGSFKMTKPGAHLGNRQDMTVEAQLHVYLSGMPLTLSSREYPWEETDVPR